MRTLAALATILLATSSSRPADACGGDFNPAPAMFIVAEHHGRVFVLLGGPVPEGAKLDWKGDDMSYDRTTIAAAPALSSALQLTLVGGKRTRVMSTKNQVFITPVFEGRNPM